MVQRGKLDNGLGIVRGDVFSIRRTIDDMPSGRTMSQAWLTVKQLYSDSDPGVFQKSITINTAAGTGAIEDTGSDGSGVLRFDITSSDSLAMTAGTTYYYDIQVLFDNSDKLTLETGTVTVVDQVTQA